MRRTIAFVLPGVAALRSYRAQARRIRSSSATDGANRSTITPRPVSPSASSSAAARSATGAPAGKSGASRKRAKQSTRIRLEMRSGCAAANGIARIPPPMLAISAGRSEPTVSRTAGMSAMNSSSVGSDEVGIGSESPVPRLSNMISRPNDARRSRSSASGGTSHCASRLPNHWSSRRMSGGPSPTTWYARWRSPRRAYRVSGIIALAYAPERAAGRPLNAERAIWRFTAPAYPDPGSGAAGWNVGRSSWRVIARMERHASRLALPSGRNRQMERLEVRRPVQDRVRCAAQPPGGHRRDVVARPADGRGIASGVRATDRGRLARAGSARVRSSRSRERRGPWFIPRFDVGVGLMAQPSLRVAPQSNTCAPSTNIVDA